MKNIAVHPQQITRNYTIQAWDQERKTYTNEASVAKIFLRAGQLFVNNRRILHPSFYANTNTISWCEKGEKFFSAGVLHLTDDGLSLSGHFSHGTDVKTALPYMVCGITDPLVYKNSLSELQHPTPILQIDYVYTENLLGDSFPVLRVQLKASDNLDWQDVTHCATTTINPETNGLNITLESPEKQSVFFSGMTKSTFEISADTTSLTGDIEAQNGEKNVWTAHLANPIIQNFIEENVPAVALVATDDLSVTELHTIAPSSDAMQQNSQNLLIENMKWAIGQMDNDWLNQFFGEVQPNLSAERQQSINQDLSFYQTKLAIAYMGWGLDSMSGQGAPKTPLTSDQKTQLENYLKTGLAKEPGYNLQMNIINRLAFVGAAPRVQQYIDDTASNWAQQLYDAIISPQQIILMVNRISIAGDMTLVNRYSTLLYTLQSSGDLATQYHKTILLACLTNLTNNAKLDDKDQLSWLTDYIQIFINQYITLPTNPTAAQAAKQQLAQDMKSAAEQMGGVLALADALANAITAAGQTGTIFSRASAAEDSFIANNPKLLELGASVAKCIKIAMWVGSLIAVIQGFENWKSLDTLEKVNLITTLVQLTGQAIEAIPDLLKIGKAAFEDLVDFKNLISGENALGEIGSGLEFADGDWLGSGNKTIEAMFDVETKEIKIEGTVFDSLLSGGRLFLKWLGPACAAAFAVVNTITFYKDIRDGASTEQKAFDGIIAASAAIETVCLTLELMEVSAAFGPAGAIFAVIGLIFVMVELFKPSSPPESPVDIFMDNNLRPFITSLPSAPKAQYRAATTTLRRGKSEVTWHDAVMPEGVE
ncbi:MAG: hypothetical protein CK424_07065 [Legionella sp.]|nr:MAG: hypothetical protein CK424_07065 [Legionella sp.]